MLGPASWPGRNPISNAFGICVLDFLILVLIHHSIVAIANSLHISLQVDTVSEQRSVPRIAEDLFLRGVVVKVDSPGSCVVTMALVCLVPRLV